MGSHSSKAAKGDVMAQDAAAAAPAGSPSKSNGQENGHVKINGDLSPKADGEAAPLSGNGSAEPVKEEAKVEAGGGDAIEPAPVAEGGEGKPEGAAAAPRETPKKKKRFSFKKSFKLSGISFRKAKKESGDASAATSPSEEPGQEEAKGGEEEGAACTSGETEQGSAVAAKEEAAPKEEKAAAVEVAPEEAAAEREEGGADPGQQEEEKPQPPRETTQEDTQLEEASKLAEADPSPAPAAPEQSEE